MKLANFKFLIALTITFTGYGLKADTDPIMGALNSDLLGMNSTTNLFVQQINQERFKTAVEEQYNKCNTAMRNLGNKCNAINSQDEDLASAREFLNAHSGLADCSPQTISTSEVVSSASEDMRITACNFARECAANSEAAISASAHQTVCTGAIAHTGNPELTDAISNFLNTRDGDGFGTVVFPEGLGDEISSLPNLQQAVKDTAWFFRDGNKRIKEGSISLFGSLNSPSAVDFTSSQFDRLVELCQTVGPPNQSQDGSTARDRSDDIEDTVDFRDPYKMYGTYSRCSEVFSTNFFVQSDDKANANDVLKHVCHDLKNMYSATLRQSVTLSQGSLNPEQSQPYERVAVDSPTSINENQIKFHHYFGQLTNYTNDTSPELLQAAYAADYEGGTDSATVPSSEAETVPRIVVSDYTKEAAVKTFYSLISPCAGLKHIVEKVDEAYPEHNRGITGVRGEIEQCFVRKGGSTDNPKSSLDFQDCRIALRWMGSDDIIGGALMPTATSALGAIRQQNIAQDASQDAANGSETASLDQQRRTHLARRDMHLINAGTRATFGGGMLHSAFTFNTPENSIRKNCFRESLDTESNLELRQGLFCSAVKLAQWDDTVREMLWTNQHMHRELAMRSANSLTSALVDGILAYVQNKNANSVQDVIDTFENAGFNQPENQVTVEPRNCVINPDDPRCPQSNLGRRPSTGGVDFQFSGTPQGGGNSGLDFISDEEFNTGDGVNSLTDGDLDSVADLSNIGSSNSDSKVGSGFDAPGAAGGRAAGSGAGGGGGGGAAGGGGGGGGGPAPEQAGGAPPADGNLGKKIAPKYLAGQDGGFRSAGSAKTANKKDPFAALRKKQQRGPSSVIDKSIMPKSSKLFEVISKRYAAAAKEGKIK